MNDDTTKTTEPSAPQPVAPSKYFVAGAKAAKASAPRQAPYIRTRADEVEWYEGYDVWGTISFLLGVNA